MRKNGLVSREMRIAILECETVLEGRWVSIILLKGAVSHDTVPIMRVLLR